MKKKNQLGYAQCIKASEYQKMEWKNHRGTTNQIAIEPPDSDFAKSNYLWRLSSAPVLEPGSFSKFAGYERLLTITKGKQMLLRFGDGQEFAALKFGEVFRFSGDAEVRSELPQGKIEDLNLVFRKDKIRAEMSVLKFTKKPRSFHLEADHIFFFVVAGGFAASTYPGEINFKLEVGDTLRIGELPAEQAKEERLVLLEPKIDNSIIAAIEIKNARN